jgi:hypothetical protein
MAEEQEVQNESPKSTPQQRETFSREYVSELREEAKAHRLRTLDLEKRYNELDAVYKQRNEEAETRIKELTLAARSKLLRAEVKTHALKAGIVDLDALKLLDMDKFKFDEETGEIENADAIFKELKTAKSYLFQQPNTSSGATQPKAAPAGPIDAMKMSKEEFKAYRRKFEETS